MANGAAELAVLLEQRGHPQMGLEVTRFLREQITAHRQRSERVRFGEMTGLLEAFADAGWREAIFDFSGGPLRRMELQKHLAAFDLKSDLAIADYNATVEIGEAKRSHRPRRFEIIPDLVEAALKRLDTAARGQQILGQAHHQEVVEGKAVAPSARAARTD